MIGVFLAVAAISGSGFIPPSPADKGHGLRLQFPRVGFDLLEAELPALIPEEIALPEFSGTLLQCNALTAITWHQQGTVIEIALRSIDISVPTQNILRVELLLDLKAHGVAFVDNAYLCFGSLSCNDSLTVRSLGVVADLAVTLDGDGVPQVDIANIDVQWNRDDLVFQLSNCFLDDIATWIVEAGKQLLFDVMIEYVQGMIPEQVAPLLQEMLASLTAYSGTVDFALFSVWGKSLTITPDGIDIVAEADLWSPYPLASCLAHDGPPPAVSGTEFPTPGHPESLLTIGLELGLLEDALYHIWRRGLLCLTDRHLLELGMPLDLDSLLTILPGYPLGTSFAVELNIVDPPRIHGSADNSATVSLDIKHAALAIIGTLPNGSVRTLAVTAGAEITAEIALQPGSGALTLQLGKAKITSFQIDDAGMGIDPERLRWTIETELLPLLLEGLQETPLLQPTRGVRNFALVARSLTTSESHVAAALELFRASPDDHQPPETSAHRTHERPMLPTEDALVFVATDDATPSELCRFEVVVDGDAPRTTFRTHLRLGTSGTTGQHHIAVAAVDLTGNVDPTPAEMDLTIDGVSPSVQVTSRKNTVTSEATAVIKWSAVDDLTPMGVLRPHLTLRRFTDAVTMTTVVDVLDGDLPSGSTTERLTFATPGSYQAVLTVYDEAGNSGIATASFSIEEGGNCRQLPVSATALLGFVLLWTCWPRRHPRHQPNPSPPPGQHP